MHISGFLKDEELLPKILRTQISEAREIIIQKLALTYKRMCQKGLALHTLRDISVYSGPGNEACKELLYAYSNNFRGQLGTEIEEHMYHTAIECAALVHIPDVVFSKDNKQFGMYLDDLLPTVYMLVICLMAEKCKPVGDISIKDKIKIEEKIARASARSALMEKYKTVQEENEILKRNNNSCEIELKQLRAKISTMNLDNIVLNYEKTIRDRNKKIDSLEETVAELNMQILDLKNKQLEIVDTESDIVDVDLPSTGVCFVGGHITLQNRVRDLFPEWTFIARGDVGFSAGDWKVAFIFYTHVGHKQVARLTSLADKDTKIVYCSHTNIDMLLDEMKRGYMLETRKEKLNK
jgi:hypothetical protein